VPKLKEFEGQPITLIFLNPSHPGGLQREKVKLLTVEDGGIIRRKGRLDRKSSHGPIVKETVFESLPLQLVMVPIPIAPETEVVLVSGGLNTNTSTIPGCAISAAVTAASNR